MTEYYIPTASAEAELVEKRSRFIGQVKPVETEEEARAFVEQVKKKLARGKSEEEIAQDLEETPEAIAGLISRLQEK